MKNSKVEYTETTSNVFDDLGFSESKEMLTKAKLAMKITDIINKHGLSQLQAAKTLKVTQPKVSALVNGRLSGFSMERLIFFLNLLDQDVEIIVKAKPSRRLSHGKVNVYFGGKKAASGSPPLLHQLKYQCTKCFERGIIKWL